MKLRHLNLDDIEKEFPELEKNSIEDLYDIMSGAVAGRNICHLWYDSASQEKVIFSGKIEKLKRKKSNMYVVAYWNRIKPTRMLKTMMCPSLNWVLISYVRISCCPKPVYERLETN
ncbi:Uncharacterised protein at_DN2580 [Pycnogonum litorale]